MRETFIRKVQKTSTHSYVINIPKELINQFKWREKQKLEVIFQGKKNELLIKDYKKPKRRKRK